MTIVLGIKVERDEEERVNSLDDCLIMVADSMGSSEPCGMKFDDRQKLFVVGENKDFLLMGTGIYGPILQVVHVIEDMPFNTLDNVAEKILEITNNQEIAKAGQPMDFIVGGKYAADGKDTLALGFVEINATGYNPFEKKPKWSNRGFKIQPRFTVDGSGTEHVHNYMEGLKEAGKEYFIDLATVFALAYECSKKGAKDTGVNDKFQFGVITKDGISTLYHPEIQLQTENAFGHYLNQMSNLSLPLEKDELEGDEKKRMLKARSDLSDMLNHFYDQFITDLREYAECRRWYTTFSEMYANDNNAKRDFEEMRARRARAKQNVQQGLNALMERGIPAILGYSKHFDERKRALEERVLKLPEIYAKAQEPASHEEENK